MRAGLEAWDDRCGCERERGSVLRRHRNGLEQELREQLLGLKNGLSGAFDESTARRLLRPVGQLAASAPALQQQAERLQGVEVDLALAAASLEEPKAELGQTLAALADCDAAERHARARRDQERERLEDLSGKVGRFVGALRALAEHRASAADYYPSPHSRRTAAVTSARSAGSAYTR